MSLWVPSPNPLYLPPAPVTHNVSTDTYVHRTSVFYHAHSERLLTVGHPLFAIKDSSGKITTPKVSPHQYRVFRLKLPDPNQFAFGDTKYHDPDKERLVWACVGCDIGRGQPLGIGVCGHPLTTRDQDVENPGKYDPAVRTDTRQNVGFDGKQTQMFILGCKPAIGEHWTKAKMCPGHTASPGECPPLELVNSVIEDGQMGDIGFGAMDFAALQESVSNVPLCITNTTSKYPDFLKMMQDPQGDSLFFYARKEQMYTRHFFVRSSGGGDVLPDDLYKPAVSGQAQSSLGSFKYWGAPSGSMVSSDAQLFNRPYWVQRAQGLNNGVCWNNELFVTVLDNTRGTNLTIDTAKAPETAYKAENYKSYVRHVEEYSLALILQLCRVSLTPDNLQLLTFLHPEVLDGWSIGGHMPVTATLEDHYRYLQSQVTPCPETTPQPSSTPKDPYEGKTFWDVDLTGRLSLDLEQFPLGRRFLYHRDAFTGSAVARPRATKRSATTRSTSASTS